MNIQIELKNGYFQTNQAVEKILYELRHLLQL